jgi:PKD repeat protein
MGGSARRRGGRGRGIALPDLREVGGGGLRLGIGAASVATGMRVQSAVPLPLVVCIGCCPNGHSPRFGCGDPAGVPVAVIQAFPQAGQAPLLVHFDGRGSYSRNGIGGIVSYDWDFGDGSPRIAGDTTSHTFVRAGSYNACLTVGNRGTADTACLTIAATAQQAPRGD